MTLPSRRWFVWFWSSIFVVVTLLIVVAGFRFSRFVTERNAVEAIIERGGTVVYFDQAYGRVYPERTMRAWFREFAGLRWPGEVYLKHTDVTDQTLRDEILPLRNLTAIGLAGTSVTNIGLGQLRPLASLASVKCLRDSRNEKVLAELSEPTTAKMQSVPVNHALEYFADLHGIAFRIDQAALPAANAGTITCDLRNLSLATTLDQILRPLDLGWIVSHGTLVITTRQTMDANAHEADVVKASLPQLKTLVVDSRR